MAIEDARVMIAALAQPEALLVLGAIVTATSTDSTGPATTTYIKADLHAVATALAAMTGQPHPLALTGDDAQNLSRETRI